MFLSISVVSRDRSYDLFQDWRAASTAFCPPLERGPGWTRATRLEELWEPGDEDIGSIAAVPGSNAEKTES